MDALVKTISNINAPVNAFVWGVPAMILILGVGLYLSIRSGFIQFRRFGYAIKNTLGKMFQKQEAGEGALTPFQAVSTALAATVGTGNIAGVAGAIALGGPGAIFWMWVSALLGMCTKFCEVTLAVHFRERNEAGEWVGGPMYYIKNGLNKKWHFLGFLYALFGALAVFGTGCATQVNTIVTSIGVALESYNVVGPDAIPMINLALGILIAVLVLFILLGGIKRLGSVTERLVPFMAVIYIILGIGVIVLNFERVPAAFVGIFEGAFSPKAVTGGIVGSMFVTMRRGISRGIFSNEAGIGTGSMAHATADVDHPTRQALYGIFEVFIDTIVICTMTGLVILTSGISFNYGEDLGAALTLQGFTATYGSWVSIVTAVAIVCFAFSTILGWGLYGSRCVEYIFKKHIAVKVFFILYALIAILGATVDLGVIWGVSDTFNGLMAIPNLIALFLLAGTVMKLSKEFFSNKDLYLKK